MAYQAVGVGTAANDGTGDALRTAFQKINANFVEVYAGVATMVTLGTVTTGTWNATPVTTTYGGTGLASYTAGDLPYYASGTTLSKLGIGTSGYILTSSGSAPQWSTPTTVTASLNAVVGDSGSGGTKGLVPAPASGDAAAGKYLKADGTWAVPAGGGGGSPAGSSGNIQYNASGSFGAMSGTSWDNTNRSLTLTGATVTTSNPVLNLTQTWNAAQTFTALKLNVTDTSSNAASLLLDLQVGGSSKFAVKKSGTLQLADGSSSDLSLFWPSSAGGSDTGFYHSGGTVTLYSAGAASYSLYYSLLIMVGSTHIRWGTSNFALSGANVGLKPPNNSDHVLGITDGSTGAGALEFTEMTAPPAGSADTARLYVEDNGSGKTRLVVKFSSGAAQVIATQP